MHHAALFLNARGVPPRSQQIPGIFRGTNVAVGSLRQSYGVPSMVAAPAATYLPDAKLTSRRTIA